MARPKTIEDADILHAAREVFIEGGALGSTREIARRMGTTQSAVARLEGGKSRPSTTTLAKFAKATGTRLRVSFEAVGG